jgi:hypothetical protein
MSFYNYTASVGEKKGAPILVLRGKYLAELGFRTGRRVEIVAARGRILISPSQEMEAQAVQMVLRRALRAVDKLRDLCMLVWAKLPEAPDEMLEGNVPMDLRSEIKGILECLVADDLDLAMDKLERAIHLTPDELFQEWEEKNTPPAPFRTPPAP